MPHSVTVARRKAQKGPDAKEEAGGTEPSQISDETAAEIDAFVLGRIKASSAPKKGSKRPAEEGEMEEAPTAVVSKRRKSDNTSTRYVARKAPPELGSRRQRTLAIPPGPLGVQISNVRGFCHVKKKTSDASPFEAGDVILALNGEELVKMEGGVKAWGRAFREGSSGRRVVLVERTVGQNAGALSAGASTAENAREMDPDDISDFVSSLKSQVISTVASRLWDTGTPLAQRALLDAAAEEFPFLTDVNWSEKCAEKDAGSTGKLGGEKEEDATASAKKGPARKMSAETGPSAKSPASAAKKRNAPGDDSEDSFHPSDFESASESKRKPRKSETGPRSRLTFEDRLEQCVAFKQQNGHLIIPLQQGRGVDGLGTWAQEMRVSRQRLLDGTLDEGRARKISGRVSNQLEQLEEIGFDASAPPPEDNAASSAKKKRGRKPSSETVARRQAELELIEAQRKAVADGDAVATRSIWDWRLQQLRAFKAEKGHMNVPSGKDSGSVLGPWAYRMRCLYIKRANGRLDELSSVERDKLRQLEEMGFAFDGAFDINLQKLVAFKEREGTTKVPVKYKEDAALAHWVEMVKRENNKTNRGEKSNYLTADRLRRLVSVGFDFTKKKEVPWEVRFEQLRAYREENGDDPPTSHPDLGYWVQKLRCYYNNKMDGGGKKHHLSDEREQQLRDIGFIFQKGNRPTAESRAKMRSGMKVSWDDRLSEFIRYLRKLVAFKSCVRAIQRGRGACSLGGNGKEGEECIACPA